MQRKNYSRKVKYPDGSRLRVGVVVSGFNPDITERMLKGALAALAACRVKKSNMKVVRVHGSFEVPLACLRFVQQKSVRQKGYDALVALGCIIKGETSHDAYIANAVSRAIMDLSLAHDVPIGFGIITPNNLTQAVARSTGETNKGKEAALAAVAMALVKSR